jgi:hypothetical protein
MKRRYSVLLLVSVAIACYGDGSTGVRNGQGRIGPEIDVSPGPAFTLAQGETAHVMGTEVLIHFDRVSEDSRCPIDVQCPWQGNAAILLELSSRIAEFAPQPIVLNTGIEPHERSILGITVRLVDLEPDPRASDPPIDPARYRVELTVTR